jgi:adsorption protein B
LEELGWHGDWPVRYLYFRDRKSLATQQFMVFGYIVALGLVGVQASAALFPERYIFAPPLDDNSPLWYLFDVNVGLLANRLVHRHVWTCRIYGWSQLPLIVPRYIVSNMVNYLAVTRATVRYLKHLRTGERIGWDKTTHSFPGEELLAVYRRKLGDVLIERGLVTKEQLERGLAAQTANRRPLGAALVDIGVLEENALIEVLCSQLRLARASAVNPYQVSLDLLRRLPEKCAKALSVFPIGAKEGGGIVLACAVVPARDGMLRLEAILSGPLEFRLAGRAEVAFALRHGYSRLRLAGRDEVGTRRVGPCPVAYRPIGELLIDIGAIGYPDLTKGLSEAAECGKRVGDYLLDEGRIRREHVAEAMARQQAGERQPGGPIVVSGDAADDDLEWVAVEGGHVAAAE